MLMLKMKRGTKLKPRKRVRIRDREVLGSQELGFVTS